MSRLTHRLGTVLLVTALIAGVIAVGAGLWLHHQLSSIPRLAATTVAPSIPAVPTGAQGKTGTLQLAADGGVSSWVIASVGSRDMTATQAQKYGIAGLGSRGGDGLTDTLIDVLVNPATHRASVLSIPRDTWVPWCECKINALLNLHGTQSLTDEVARITGVPTNHIALLNFAAFGEITDSLGGVSVDVTRPLRDSYSGLHLTTTGCQVLDGRAALALVRSRHTQTLRGGGWVSDPSASDFGREARQQVYLHAVTHALLTPSAVLQVPELLATAKADLTLDATVGTGQLIELARAFASAGGGQLATFSLPGTTGRVGAASVVFTDKSTAPAVLAAFQVAAGRTPTAGTAAATTSSTPAPAAAPAPATSGPTPAAAAPSSPATPPLPTGPDPGITACA